MGSSGIGGFTYHAANVVEKQLVRMSGNEAPRLAVEQTLAVMLSFHVINFELKLDYPYSDQCTGCWL